MKKDLAARRVFFYLRRSLFGGKTADVPGTASIFEKNYFLAETDLGAAWAAWADPPQFFVKLEPRRWWLCIFCRAQRAHRAASAFCAKKLFPLHP